MTGRVRFGIFELDVSRRELRREGVLMRLQPQPMQVLCALVDHAGEVVTREQLRQAVWGTETFVDFERGLNYCIAQIRITLGDSAESPRFVRTIPKSGYQFVAPVVAASEAAPAAAPRVRKRARRTIVLLAAAACALAAFLVIAQRRPAVNIAIARFDNETGNAEMDSFADGLTDAVVAELTTAGNGRYGIIGNSALLRRPRGQRDLAAIGSSLNAGYVVLGQVQRNSSQIRVLAHLIRLPQQTHVFVVRFDRDVTDPLAAESELGRRIANEFLQRVKASP